MSPKKNPLQMEREENKEIVYLNLKLVSFNVYILATLYYDMVALTPSW